MWKARSTNVTDVVLANTVGTHDQHLMGGDGASGKLRANRKQLVLQVGKSRRTNESVNKPTMGERQRDPLAGTEKQLWLKMSLVLKAWCAHLSMRMSM